MEDRGLAARGERVVACQRCPRLVSYRAAVAHAKRRSFREEVYWGRRVRGSSRAASHCGIGPAPHGAGDFLMGSLHRASLALGRIAFDGCGRALRELGADGRLLPFAPGASYAPGAGLPTLVASSHPLRQNTQAGRLTVAMFDRALARALSPPAPP
ncbi:MAG TPA: hypothetical protein PLN64_00135 [Candidatus Bipolaricaulis anaerobius]|nr:hypothetical protein [Candidatus Bipolaricaulis anaerobius]